MTTALEVAKVLIQKARENGIDDISPLKLQKLLFLSYEKKAIKDNYPLFDGTFEVWRHGPVMKDVYDYYKHYGSEIIDEDIIETTDLSNQNMDLINEILSDYGDITAWGLVDITHRNDGIWHHKMSLGENSITFKDIQTFKRKS